MGVGIEIEGGRSCDPVSHQVYGTCQCQGKEDGHPFHLRGELYVLRVTVQVVEEVVQLMGFSHKTHLLKVFHEKCDNDGIVVYP